MFTGLVEQVGVVRECQIRPDGARLRIEWDEPAEEELGQGESIAVDGVCLTVVSRGPGWFETDLALETLKRSTLGERKEGEQVNLERALRLGDRLGGHLVQGHVDGVADLLEVRPEGEGKRIRLAAPGPLAGYIVEKGSVALDGVSLTVASGAGKGFEVALIPHTLAITTLGRWTPPRKVNLEVDLMAKYVESLLTAWRMPHAVPHEDPTEKET